MGFYYISFFSAVPLGIAYGLLALVYWGIVRGTRTLPGRTAILSVLGVSLLILPVAEEFWIAWNYGQACKQAGTFVHRTVQVDGFYDDTRSTHAGEPNRQAVESFDKTGYRFLEMKGPNQGVVHLEKVDGQWRPTLVDRPTARYHYRSINHAPVAHKVVRHEYNVIDTKTKEVIGQELKYGRYAPWFFIGLDSPVVICSGTRSVKGSIYENVLFPISGK